jgi:hypothetical protein
MQIQCLRQREEIAKTLREDGWHLEGNGPHDFSARHPRVFTESAARNRLGHIGLLTCSSLRIEFRPKTPTDHNASPLE